MAIKERQVDLAGNETFLDSTGKVSVLSADQKFALSGGVRNLSRVASELCFGNSLGIGYSGFSTTQSSFPGFASSSAMAFANMLHPISNWPKAITPITDNGTTGGVDTYGNYGFSGKSVALMLTDLETWFTALDNAGIIPDIVNFTGIFENDVAFYDTPTATTQKQTLALIEAISNKWQNVRFKIATPHPDTRANNTVRKAAFLSARDFALKLDDGTRIFTYDLSGPGSYADPLDITQPLVGFTDGIVHPDARGASVIGRIEAATNVRISSRIPTWLKTYRSADRIGLGATSQSGNGYNGTRWTNISFPSVLGDGSANQALVTAGNPGALNCVWTPQVVGNTLTTQMAMTAAGQKPALLTTNIASWARIRINSGAANIRQVCSQLQALGTPANTGIQSIQTHSTNAIYKDGDILTLTSPALAQPTSTNTGVYMTLRVFAGATGSPIDFDILGCGYIDLA